MVIDTETVPEVLSDGKGNIDPERVLLALGVRNESDMRNYLLNLFIADPQVTSIVASKMIIAAKAAVEGLKIPSWGKAEDYDNERIAIAEDGCAKCGSRLNKVMIAGKEQDACQLSGVGKFVWCEAYRLRLIGGQVPPVDLDRLAEVAFTRSGMSDSGYAEDPMHEERIQKSLDILSKVDSLELNDISIYQVASELNMQGDLAAREFKKMWEVERTIVKYLIPEGMVEKLPSNRCRLIQEQPPAVTPEAVTPEAVIPEAVTPEAVKIDSQVLNAVDVISTLTASVVL